MEQSCVIAVCNGNEALYSYPSHATGCQDHTSSFWEEWIRVPATGISNTNFYFKVPISYNLLYKLFLVVCLIIAVVSSFFVLWSLRAKFQNQVLAFFEDPSLGKECPIDEIRDLLNKRTLLEEETKRRAIQEAVISTYRQVGHDMRSPLSALNIAIHTSESFTGSRKSIAEAAIDKLKEMTDELLKKGEINHKVSPVSEDDIVEIANTLQTSFDEKKLEFAHHQQLNLSLKIDPLAHSVKIRANVLKLQRTISNLINNAYEALPQGKGEIKIELTLSSDNALIRIVDDGSGISKDIISLIQIPGFSFGKKDGHGLGLSYVKETIEGLGGSIKIASKENHGTSVEIALPRV